MNLDHRESKLLFEIMKDLTQDFEHAEVRLRMGRRLLDLLNADYFASFVYDQSSERFVAGVHINMDPDNLARYEEYFQFRDPTPILHRRTKATPVSLVMQHDKLSRTEFFNDFLIRDGLCYGINFYARHLGQDVGDLRVWRKAGKEDFSLRDAEMINAMGPSLANALARASRAASGLALPCRSFAADLDRFGLSAREGEVADLLTSGRTDAEICETLRIAKPTLRTHVTSIFKKTRVARRSQLSGLLFDGNHHL